MYEHETQKPLVIRTPPAGEIYLQGYADGYHGRAPTVQPTQRAQKHYAKGYDAGSAARKAQTPI